MRPATRSGEPEQRRFLKPNGAFLRSSRQEHTTNRLVATSKQLKTTNRGSPGHSTGNSATREQLGETHADSRQRDLDRPSGSGAVVRLRRRTHRLRVARGTAPATGADTTRDTGTHAARTLTSLLAARCLTASFPGTRPGDGGGHPQSVPGACGRSVTGLYSMRWNATMAISDRLTSKPTVPRWPSS